MCTLSSHHPLVQPEEKAQVKNAEMEVADVLDLHT